MQFKQYKVTASERQKLKSTTKIFRLSTAPLASGHRGAGGSAVDNLSIANIHFKELSRLDHIKKALQVQSFQKNFLQLMPR